MAETIDSLRKSHNMSNPFTTLDPKSLLLSQFSQNSDQFHTFELKSEFFERGPRYNEYAERRESLLKLKHLKQSIPIIEEEKVISLSPEKKQVKFPLNVITTPPRRAKGNSSVLAQSVPDFSYALRKENRKPLPALMEKSVTPPLKSKSGKYDGMFGKTTVAGGGGGSKSAKSERRQSGGGFGFGYGGGGVGARKSCVNLEEFKGLASNAKTAINVEARGMKNANTKLVVGKSISAANRQF